MNTEDFVCSEKITNLMTALSALHKKNLKVVKDGNNPHFNSKHATLPGVLETLHEPLQSAGLVVTQMPLGGVDICRLMTRVSHAASGEYIQWIYASPVSKRDPQGFGSAITYAKRYALIAFFGMPEKDDDSNEASTEVYEETNEQKIEMAKQAKELGISGKESLVKLSEYLLGVPMKSLSVKIKHYIDKHK